MVKTHKVLVKIKNKSDLEMTYIILNKWYHCGQSNQDWVKAIPNGDHHEILSYETDWDWLKIQNVTLVWMKDHLPKLL